MTGWPTQFSEAAPLPEPLKSLMEVNEAAGELATRIVLSAQGISKDSTESLGEANPDLGGTGLAEEWPLSEYGLRSLFESVASVALKGIKPDMGNPVVVAGLEINKYRPDLLETAYHSDDPRIDFARDLTRWAEAMSRKDRAVIVSVDLGEGVDSRVEVSVYEDKDVVRDWLLQFTDGSLIDEELAEQGYEEHPNVWVNSQVLVRGDKESIERVEAELL